VEVGFVEFEEKQRRNWDFVEMPCKHEEDLEGSRQGIGVPSRYCCLKVVDVGNLEKYEEMRWEESRSYLGEED